jgi:RNA polymerase sigma-70 factor (ECF subfamily)
MKQLIENDNEAFNELYKRYNASIYSYLYYSVDQNTADELLQEIFLKVIKSKSGFKFESKFKTWLWTITKNTVIDHYRSAEHNHRNSFDELTNEEGEESFAIELDSMEEMILQKTQKKYLEICFNELSKEQKEATLLSIHSELSNAEIAAIMNLSVGAVKSLLFRSKEKLIECCKKGGHV